MSEQNRDYQILLFYKYTNIENSEELADQQRALCQKLCLKGRLIIAKEGLNITLEGLKDNTEKYIHQLTKDSRFKDIHFKKSVGTGNAFPKLSVKVRSEIVSGHLDELDVNPNDVTGKYLTAEELHELIHSDQEFYIVDMRNDYEHKVGHFEGSILPPLRNFRDLKSILPTLESLKDKKIITVCTGGVRCEKASGFLVKNGFNNVYQLHGGIVTYMEKYPNEDFLGQLYVFDNRIIMGFNTDSENHKIIGKCEKCYEASESYVNCGNNECHLHFICCESCFDADGKAYCSGDCKEIVYAQ